MKLNSLQLLRSNNSLNLARTKIGKKSSAIGASLLTLTAAAFCYQPEKAAAVDLDFTSCSGTLPVTNATYGSGFGSNTINCTGVATNVDARITATVSGANYNFNAHFPNYNSTASNGTAEPNNDLGSRYEIAGGQTGSGTMTYKIDLFDSGTTNPYTAAALRFLMYDVDGESNISDNIIQSEAVRIAKNSGFTSYQVGNTPQALVFSEDASSYLFSGRGKDVLENNSSGAAIFYFQNTNSVTFEIEANTLISNASPNRVFTAIDGDLSYLSSFSGGFTPVTAVPEPFTIIGTIIGGTAALRLRKKLKSGK